MNKIDELEKLLNKKMKEEYADPHMPYVDHLFYEAAYKLIEEIKGESREKQENV